MEANLCMFFLLFVNICISGDTIVKRGIIWVHIKPIHSLDFVPCRELDCHCRLLWTSLCLVIRETAVCTLGIGGIERQLFVL